MNWPAIILIWLAASLPLGILTGSFLRRAGSHEITHIPSGRTEIPANGEHPLLGSDAVRQVGRGSSNGATANGFNSFHGASNG